jgi:hypothetical protein
LCVYGLSWGLSVDKQARLSSIMLAINENIGKEAQAFYGAEMALKTREYAHVKRCAEKLIAAQAENIILSNEAKELQIEIETERMDLIL